ncbi:MAG: hypothetical protein IJA73_02890 [Oscillospiraceae bacterium]|nr:hypothetical protein [Oscillospiraceae bacterium]
MTKRYYILLSIDVQAFFSANFGKSAHNDGTPPKAAAQGAAREKIFANYERILAKSLAFMESIRYNNS